MPERPRARYALAVLFAMYVLGASLGPVATGLLSDHFAARAARAAGVVANSAQALEPFRAQGLHGAMQILPLLGSALVAALLAAARAQARASARS